MTPQDVLKKARTLNKGDSFTFTLDQAVMLHKWPADMAVLLGGEYTIQMYSPTFGKIDRNE